MKFSSGPDLSLQVENQQLRDENEKLKKELLTKTTQQSPQHCYMKVEDKTGIRVTYCMLDKGHKGKCQ